MKKKYVLAIIVGAICCFITSLILDRVWVTGEIKTYKELISDTIQITSVLVVVIFLISRKSKVKE